MLDRERAGGRWHRHLHRAREGGAVDAAGTPNAHVAVASNGTIDPTAGNNAADTNPDVAIITRANLTVTLVSAAPANLYASTDTTKSTVTFTVTFHNDGPSDARNSTLRFNPLSTHLGNVNGVL